MRTEDGDRLPLRAFDRGGRNPLVEGHEHARMTEIADAGGEQLGREHCLAGTRGAHHERAPAVGQSAVGDQV